MGEWRGKGTAGSVRSALHKAGEDSSPASSTAKFDGSYVGQKGNRGAPLRIRSFLFTLLPTIISFPRRLPLSLCLSLLNFLSLDRESERHRDGGDLPPFSLARAIYRGLISIAPPSRILRAHLPDSQSPFLYPILSTFIRARRAIRSQYLLRSTICGPARLLLFSATSSPSSPVFAPTFKLYLNRRPVIYIIDFRNAPVGIRNDFIFKRGKPG